MALLTCVEGREILDRVRASTDSIKVYRELEREIKIAMPDECYYNAND